MSSTAKPILILSGPPGVGKTTVAEILAGDSDRAVHLEGDAFFRFIRAGYVEPWEPESDDQNRTVMGIVGRAAAGYAAAGYFTIVEGIVIPGWFYEPLREALRDAGHDVAYAVLRAPLSVCAKRVRSRGGQRLSDGAALQQLWRGFSELGELEANVLEVDGMEPREVSASLARRLEDGLLRV